MEPSVQKIMEKEFSRLCNLLEKDPVEAVVHARELQIPGDPGDAAERVRSAIFIDAGTDTGILGLVEEGIEILRKLIRCGDDSPDTKYNLANGLCALGEQAEMAAGDHSWLLHSAQDRSEARRLYQDVADSECRESLRGCARTNLANMLVRSGRWAEAYESYVQATFHDPSNAIALSGAAKILLFIAQYEIGDPTALRGLAKSYKCRAEKAVNSTQKHSGRRADQSVESVPPIVEEAVRPDLGSLGKYERFVVENRLVLSPTVEGIGPGLKQWDSLRIYRISESIDASSGVPPIFAMFNLLKADFLAARWLVYCAIENPPVESGSYGDTLDYAVYGVSSSLLTMAHRSAIDLLDRVAVAASEYFQLPGQSDQISFLKCWHTVPPGKPGHPVEWRMEVREEIEQGNRGLSALAELAEDLARGGALNAQRTLRNISTHRFAVLHDGGATSSRATPHVEHLDLCDFELRTLEAFRMARSAILYLTEAVAVRESRLEVSRPQGGTLIVPCHHHVRSSDNDSDE